MNVTNNTSLFLVLNRSRCFFIYLVSVTLAYIILYPALPSPLYLSVYLSIYFFYLSLRLICMMNVVMTVQTDRFKYPARLLSPACVPLKSPSRAAPLSLKPPTQGTPPLQQSTPTLARVFSITSSRRWLL